MLKRREKKENEHTSYLSCNRIKHLEITLILACVCIEGITLAPTGNREFQPKQLLLSASSSRTWVNNLNGSSANTSHRCTWMHNIRLKLIVCNTNRRECGGPLHAVGHTCRPDLFLLSRNLVYSKGISTCHPLLGNKYSTLINTLVENQPRVSPDVTKFHMMQSMLGTVAKDAQEIKSKWKKSIASISKHWLLI